MSAVTIKKIYIPEATALRFHAERDQYFVRLIRGVPASGKSVMSLQEILLWGFLQEPLDGIRRTRFVVVRATYPELRATTIKTWQDWVPPELWPVKQSIPFSCRIKFDLPDGTKADIDVIFMAVETEEDVKKLKSLELTGAFVNEAFQVSRTIITTLVERVGRFPKMEVERGFKGPTRSGVWCDTNSPSDKHWWAKDERNPPEGWKFYVQPAPLIRIKDAEGVTVGWKDNPLAENIRNLTLGYDYYRRQIPGLKVDQIRVNIENQFASTFAGKAVYEQDWSDDIITPHRIEVIPGELALVGMDTSGLNPAAVIGQTALGALNLLDEIVAFDVAFEIYLDQIFLPTIRQKYAHCPILVIVDPSNPRDARTGTTPLQLLTLRGIPAIVAPSNNPKLRIDSMKHFLRRRKGLNIDPSLNWLIDGFKGGYGYAKLRGAEDRYNDTPAKSEWSHVHDAGQYLTLHLRRGDNAGSKAEQHAKAMRSGKGKRSNYRYA